jgi:hypothetical protein
VVLFWEVLKNFRRWTELEEVSHWGVSLGAVSCAGSLSASFCFLYTMRGTTTLSTSSCHHDALPRRMELSNQELNPLKVWTKIKLSSFKLLMAGILPSDEKVNNILKGRVQEVPKGDN